MRCAHYLVVFKNPLDGSVPLFLAQKIMLVWLELFYQLSHLSLRNLLSLLSTLGVKFLVMSSAEGIL